MDDSAIQIQSCDLLGRVGIFPSAVSCNVSGKFKEFSASCFQAGFWCKFDKFSASQQNIWQLQLQMLQTFFE